jgi:hypothetical protein
VTSGGKVSGATGVRGQLPARSGKAPSRPATQLSRVDTRAITVHFPEEVRRQLKAMAGEQGRDVSDMVAEALNMLFSKYHRPEVAPRK